MKHINAIAPRTLKKRTAHALEALGKMNGFLEMTEVQLSSLVIVATDKARQDHHYEVHVKNEKIVGILTLDLRIAADVMLVGSLQDSGWYLLTHGKEDK